MARLETSLDRRSDTYRQNHTALAQAVATLRANVDKVAEGGGETARARHLKRGKLLPRDRVRTLLDQGALFLELSHLASFGMYADEVPCAGMITGIGRVSGRKCLVIAHDATVKGGTYFPMTV